MKAVDTYILVRFLVGDDEAQGQVVYTFDKKAGKYELFELIQ